MSNNVVFPNKGTYEIEKRENVFKKSGYEWALNLDIGAGYWTIYEFEKEPSQEEIDNIIDIVIRSIEVYHKAIRFPTYKMSIKKQKM